MQRILVIGATSAIAEAVLRRCASRGDALFLVGRRRERLDAIAGDLSVRGAPRVSHAILDVNDVGAHAAVLDDAWAFLGGVDVALIAHGTLPSQEACDKNPQYAVSQFHTNATCTIALAAELSRRLEARPGSSLVVISSVAGDRGRASNYLYGSAKAAVTEYLSGLGQRLHSLGVNVVTVKPGFVDTPMTSAFRKGFLWASPDSVAKGIVHAVDRRRSVVYLPGFWRWVMFIIRHIPESIFRRIKL